MCGENTSPIKSMYQTGGSPPHVRGKLIIDAKHNGRQGITPACAGKTDYMGQSLGMGQDHPRMCGENLAIAPPTRWPAGSPPHVRGKRNYSMVVAPVRGITPACAGKTCY